MVRTLRFPWIVKEDIHMNTRIILNATILAGLLNIVGCGDSETVSTTATAGTTPASQTRWTVDTVVGAIETASPDQVSQFFISGDMFPGVGKIPLVGGFYKGKHIDYWFYPAFMKGAVRETPKTAPIYHFVHRENAGDPRAKSIGKPVINVVPGDKDYSPFWEIVTVVVPENYKADDIKSEASITQAQEEGIFELVPTGKAVNCPVVKAGTEIEDNYPDSSPFHVANVRYWYKGMEVTAHDYTESDGLLEVKGNPDFGGANTIEAPPGYVPHRGEMTWAPGCMAPKSADGCMPLDMPMPVFEAMVSMAAGAKMDLNGDGDTKDGPNIFDVIQGDEGYSPLWEIHAVHVPPTVDLTDTMLDPSLSAEALQMESAYRSLDDLKKVYSQAELDMPAKFMPDPSQGNHYVNCPAKRP